MQRKYIPFFVFALLLAFTIPWSLNLLSLDYATSVVPGWHTTIYPPYFLIDIIMSVIILIVVLAYLHLAQKNGTVKLTTFITHLALTIPATILTKFPMVFWFLPQFEPKRLIFFETQFTLVAYSLFVVGQAFFAFYYYKANGLIVKSS